MCENNVIINYEEFIKGFTTLKNYLLLNGYIITTEDELNINNKEILKIIKMKKHGKY